MLRAGVWIQRSLRWGTLGVAALVAVTAVTSDADARARKHHRPAASAARYQPPYASIVVDANTGAVMQATNADAVRHPASLTKIMTLYLLFERLEQGKTKLTSEMPVSAHAAAQAPSKLGLRAGETIQVETAIRAIVTKSANDVAVIVGEYLGGTEDDFGRMMTAKARALGMKSTIYRNASGLPDDEQVTTARDQAILGRAIHDRFPQYYRYFATRVFEFRGRAMRNHNHLLGNIEGVDGIKTGYIRDSGFNIVTSARRNGRHVVAVVFGGSTAAARDARVRSLIENNINIAAAKRTAPAVVEGWQGKTQIADAKAVPVPAPARDPREETDADAPSVGSTDPIKPRSIKTLPVRSATTKQAALSPLPPDNQKLTPPTAQQRAMKVTTVATIKAAEPALAAMAASEPALQPAKPAKIASTSAAVPVVTTEAADVSRSRGGWMIQVGAFPDESEAKQRLNEAQGKAKSLLGRADPFTEKIAKGDKSLYRARFAGLDKEQAENACKSLKRSDIPCMMLKN